MKYLKTKNIFYTLLLFFLLLLWFGLDDFNGYEKISTDGGVFGIIHAIHNLSIDSINFIAYLFYLPIILFVKHLIIGVFVPEVYSYEQITLNMSFARIFSTFFIVSWTLLSAWLIFYVVNKKKFKNNPLNKKVYLKKIIKYFSILFVILNLGIFLNFNIANLSSPYIVKACRNDESACLENYVLAKYSNCDNDFVLFVFPFKIKTIVDTCTTDRLIENNILSDISYIQLRKLNDAIIPGMMRATDEKKIDYCESFTNSKTKKSCLNAFPVSDDKN